ncbi:MAG: hypothetical protein PHP89_04770 [Candidatus Omnitrophica bacterium]|jgi:hypothetical protein|nr:hypothetical protein [Candidatus Omnitrophota bacterium]MDD3987886.1 hypothetical protein [Candidatus Omnitrophota bacterium]MDD4982094.1 hypothetical protein [Candidatus Omnitrophota bacterium]MDD5665379.1 hypothetical protein [Candidatus Omnitrophota bacterium]
MRKVEGQITAHRVITMLGREEIDFLDKMGKDALFSTGHKLSYNEILRGLIDFAMEAGISGDNIDSPASLKLRLKEYINRIKGHN